MFEIETNMPDAEITQPVLDAALVLLRIAADPKGCQARLDAFVAGSARLKDERAAAAREAKVRTAALDEREAAIAKLEAASEAREEAVQIREEAVDKRYAKIDEAAAMVRQGTDLFKRRLMHYAGIVVHPLQSEPTFEVVENLLRGAVDAHYDDNDTKTERGQVTGEVEPVPDAPQIATIRRAKSVQRTRHDH
jgi:hypothetical protein